MDVDADNEAAPLQNQGAKNDDGNVPVLNKFCGDSKATLSTATTVTSSVLVQTLF